MALPIDRILRQSRGLTKYNILCAPTHEAYETGLAVTGHNFFAFPNKHFKTWNSAYRPVPDNYQILKSQNIPLELEFDFVLSQNKFGQYQVLSSLAQQLNLPLISLEHTLPIPSWPKQQYEECQKMRGVLNVFISEYSTGKWGFNRTEPNVRVIHHGIDTNVFKPSEDKKDGRILSVVNDWINRDWCCNFQGWHRTIQGLPYRVMGDTKGFSLPSRSVEELVQAYQTCSIFYNTSTISPVPTSLMEAMSCGAAVVSTATCMIPEIIDHGYNGFISNDEKELRQYLEMLLSDQKLASQIGQNARQTIVERFNLDKFVSKWNTVFREVYNIGGF